MCKFYKDIKSDWQNSRYIAVIQKQEDYQETPVSMVFKNGNDSCEFDIHLVYWENIMENDILKGYVIPTLDYNEAKKSQILNNHRERR